MVSLRHQKIADHNQTVNWKYFDGPLTAEKVYILGYLWADGGVYDEKGHSLLKLECHTQDEEILYWVRERLESKHKVSYQEAGKYKPGDGPKITCQICSTNLVRVLVDTYGILPRKSYKDCSYPTYVPSTLLSHFVRGYFDGDGCISFSLKSRQWYVAGSPRFIAGMQTAIVDQVRIPRYKLHEQGSLRKAVWAAKPDLVKLYRWLYQDNTFYCSRKKKKFEAGIRGY